MVGALDGLRVRNGLMKVGLAVGTSVGGNERLLTDVGDADGCPDGSDEGRDDG